jgi:hypothetical protein
MTFCPSDDPKARQQQAGEEGERASGQEDFGSAPSGTPENTIGDAGREAMGMGRGSTQERKWGMGHAGR